MPQLKYLWSRKVVAPLDKYCKRFQTNTSSMCLRQGNPFDLLQLNFQVFTWPSSKIHSRWHHWTIILMGLLSLSCWGNGTSKGFLGSIRMSVGREWRWKRTYSNLKRLLKHMMMKYNFSKQGLLYKIHPQYHSLKVNSLIANFKSHSSRGRQMSQQLHLMKYKWYKLLLHLNLYV